MDIEELLLASSISTLFKSLGFGFKCVCYAFPFQPYQPISMNMTTLDATINYIKKLGWVYPSIEGRIQFVEQSENHASISSLSIIALAAAFLIIQLIRK